MNKFDNKTVTLDTELTALSEKFNNKSSETEIQLTILENAKDASIIAKWDIINKFDNKTVTLDTELTALSEKFDIKLSETEFKLTLLENAKDASIIAKRDIMNKFDKKTVTLDTELTALSEKFNNKSSEIEIKLTILENAKDASIIAKQDIINKFDNKTVALDSELTALSEKFNITSSETENKLTIHENKHLSHYRILAALKKTANTKSSETDKKLAILENIYDTNDMQKHRFKEGDFKTTIIEHEVAIEYYTADFKKTENYIKQYKHQKTFKKVLKDNSDSVSKSLDDHNRKYTNLINNVQAVLNKLSVKEQKSKLNMKSDNKAEILGFGSAEVNFSRDKNTYSIYKNLTEEQKKRFNQEEAEMEVSASRAVSNAWRKAEESVDSHEGTSYNETSKVIEWQNNARFQIWRKTRIVLRIDNKQTESTEYMNVRAVENQPTEEELVRMACAHLSREYFNGRYFNSTLFRTRVKVRVPKITVPQISTLEKSMQQMGEAVEKMDNLNDAFQGTIVVWKSDVIPKGWLLCDGTKGTPDMRSRFVLGHDGREKTRTLLNKGGHEKILLKVSELPTHAHGFLNKFTTLKKYNVFEDGYDHANQLLTFKVNEDGYWENSVYEKARERDKKYGKPTTHSGSKHRVTEHRGGSEPHDNMPPFIVLSYIMKYNEDNKCTCANGPAYSGSECPIAGAQGCKSCNNGFTHKSKQSGDECINT